MSSALAISGVTAVLQFYLGNVYSGLSTLFGGSVTVSSQAPDIVQASLGTGSTLQNQVNLFLHQVTHNPGWRNVDLPSTGADGQSRLTNPPLALDLHYLLTAYGSNDWQAEALLGYALLLLHQNPVLPRNDIRNALNALPVSNPLNPLSTPLGTSGLADQIEMIKITPATLGREELAWLWTALKADYRPTFPFRVSVVLLQPQLDLILALPVLSRSLQVHPLDPASILQVTPPGIAGTALPGDTVVVVGEFLGGATQVSLANPGPGIERIVPSAAVTNTSLSFVVPNDPANFPAGIYSVAVRFTNSLGVLVQTTNSLALAVAPAIVTPPPVTSVNNPQGTLVTLHCNPQVRPSQAVLLMLNSSAAPARPFSVTSGTLSFQFTPTLAPGPRLARMEVDGVPSQVQVDWTKTPPIFTGPMVTI